MARRQMGNKSLSPSLAAFGFTSKKRSNDNGAATAEAAGSPPKRVKTGPTGVDVMQDGNDSEERRREQRDLMNATSDNAELSQSTRSAAAAAPPALSPPRNQNNASTSSPTQHNNLPNSLGLIRVQDPNHILCTTTAANARSNSHGIKKVFPGATLGRTSNSTGRDASFVDLGISGDAKGISRKHVRILRIHGLSSHPEIIEDETSVLTTYSSSSVVSSSSTVVSTAAASTLSNPTMLIQVMQHPNPNRKTLKIRIHRTRRGKRRALDLKQNESKTLRVGDAIEFISDGERYYFCVVAFCDEKMDLEDVVREKNGLEQNVAVDENQLDDSYLMANIDSQDTVAMNTTEGAFAPEILTEVKSTVQDAAGSKTEFTEVTAPAIAPAIAPTASSLTIQKLVVNPAQTLKKGDSVRVVYQIADAFGIEHEEWHYGKVGLIRANSQGTHNVNIAFNSGENDRFDIPHPEVEAVDDTSTVHSQQLKIGDYVECHFQNNSKWYHGRMADIDADGSVCQVLYHDGDYEVNIPTSDKVRMSRPGDADYGWLIDRPTLIGRKGTINVTGASAQGECVVTFEDDGSKITISCRKIVNGDGAYLLSNCKPPKKNNASDNWLHDGQVLIGRKGVIKDAPRDNLTSNCRVIFQDGSEESISVENVLKGVFACVLQTISLNRQHIWPTEKLKVTNVRQEAVAPKSINNAPRVNRKASDKRVSIKLDDADSDCERVVGHRLILKKGLNVSVGDAEKESIHKKHDDAEFTFIGSRKVARPLPPGIPNMLWHALNCPEAKTGYNMLQDFLCVHDRVPGPDMISKLWQLMINGPKADGQNVYFKDPFRTELASQYVYSLVHHSKRLIRSDGSSLFGPSEWSDIESLLEQSTTQTEGMTAGKRLADGLHLAARGTKLLLLLLQTELREVDLTSPRSTSLESLPLEIMPTVQQFIANKPKKRSLKSDGVRESLKSAIRHATKCLVRHSYFINDEEDFHPERPSRKHNLYDESCTQEATECFENLGKIVSYSAFLFCASERVELDDSSVLYLIRDEFYKELLACLDNMPELNKASSKKFTSTLEENFIGAIGEGFFLPLFVGLAKLMDRGEDVVELGISFE